MKPGLQVAGRAQLCSWASPVPYSPSHWQEKGHRQGSHDGVVVTVGPEKRGTAVSTYFMPRGVGES